MLVESSFIQREAKPGCVLRAHPVQMHSSIGGNGKGVDMYRGVQAIGCRGPNLEPMKLH